mmetsp:Transcript_43423/g.72371  ORF Transcript_43423/g.72371 Transcript_43423/m.72371 type:complete len:303 (+) Transcript_43423:84-992(+)
MARPHHLDCLGSADTRPAGVPCGPEPVVLGGPRRARPPAHVGGAIHRAAQDLVLEGDVVGDDGGGEVVVHALARLQHQVDLRVQVVSHHLEGAEDLGGAQLEVLRLQQLLQRHVHCRGLDGAVALRDRVIGQLLASPEQLGTADVQKFARVPKHALRGLRENGPNGQILHGPSLGQRLHLLQQPQGLVVLVHEHDGLRAALLSAAGVRVLVALPGRVVHILHVRPEDLPVEASVFDLHFPRQRLGEVLRRAARARELRRPHMWALEKVLHHRPIAVHDVHVRERHAAVVQQAHKLLRHQRGR